MKRLFTLFVLLISALSWVSTTTAQDTPVPRTQYPVTIENCGRTLTIAAPPQRALATWQNTAEILLALGLEDRLVGVYYGQPYAELPEFAGQYDSFSIFPQLQRPSRELIVSVEADFVFSAYPTADFNADRGLVTAEEFLENGANVYGLSDQCIDNPQTFSLDNLYQDMLNIGIIFDVQAEAQALVADMQGRIAAVQERVSGREPVDVIMIDRGSGPIGVWGRGYESVLIELAGGRNLFGDADSSYVEVNIEAFAAQDPDLFIVYDYEDAEGVPDEAEYAAFLFETFPNLRPSQEQRYALIGAETNTGIRAPLAVERLAQQFHPEAFAAQTDAARTQYPVTVESCGQEIVIPARPERAIASWTGYAGNLLALGLDESLIGYYYAFSSDTDVNPPDIQQRLEAITLLGTDGSAPSREIVIPLQPDFFYSGGEFDFAEGQASRDDFAAMGTTIYTTSYACLDAADQTIDAFLDEMITLGIIFDRQAEAGALVAEMRAGLDAIAAQVGDAQPVGVIWLDAFSSDPIYPLGNGYYTDVIQRAGGVNLFEGATYDTPPSREALAVSAPEVILMITYPDTEALIADYETVFQNAPAVAADRLIAGPYYGPLRTVELVAFAARALHPAAFE
jgi:iron complex transport system substrate-binding protein